MRVLFIINELYGGGRERRMVQLIRGLSNMPEYEMALYIPRAQRIDYPDVLNYNVQLHLLKDKNRAEARVYLEKLICDFKPDIVHVWTGDMRFLPKMLKLKKLMGFKLIAGGVADAIVNPLFSKDSLSQQLSFFFSDLIVSNSKAGLVAKRAPLKKSRVVFNGFDYNRFSQDFDETVLREELTIPNDAKIVAMIARVEKSKDYDSFIAMAQMAQEQNKPLFFLAVGKGDMLDICRDKVREFGLTNILFTEFRSDVENIVRICFATVLFSNAKVHSEGISNSVLESLAAGVPVIATSGGGTNEIIQHGKNGYIVLPEDYQAAYSFLLDILSNDELHNSLSKGAVDDVKERFLLSTMVKNYCAIYDELLS